MDAYRKAFLVAAGYLLGRACGVVDALEAQRHVYTAAGTIYIAPGRTVRDWVQDLADTGVLEPVGPARYRVPCPEALARVLRQVVETA